MMCLRENEVLFGVIAHRMFFEAVPVQVRGYGGELRGLYVNHKPEIKTYDWLTK